MLYGRAGAVCGLWPLLGRVGVGRAVAERHLRRALVLAAQQRRPSPRRRASSSRRRVITSSIDFDRLAVDLRRSRRRRAAMSAPPIVTWVSPPLMPAFLAGPVDCCTSTPSSVGRLRLSDIDFGDRRRRSRRGRRARPCRLSLSWSAIFLTVLIGTAKPMPTDAAAAAGRDLGVDPDHAAVAVEQRAARVAGVDRRVGLDHVADREAVGGLELALEGAHDAGRDRAVEAERVADRDHRVADLDLGRVAERRAASGRPSSAFDLQQRDVGARVACPRTLGVDGLVVAEADLDLARRPRRRGRW